MRDAIAYLLLALGVLIELFGVLGICVMRNTLDRLHCASLASWGALLIGLAILVRESFSLLGDKALLTGALAVLLSPVLMHTTARSFRVRTRGDWRAMDDAQIVGAGGEIVGAGQTEEAQR
ncbi:MAG TPA: monovalent cation/H(+) antiporter subunit G [Solirubrobacteraceae bacterium]|jgi:monovalent cation/proton antiporter MnhG/PhaG subunit|nr:monovalent cation/H(+) antiporter subunit G [Solirubrobacteraceae bacterium]